MLCNFPFKEFSPWIFSPSIEELQLATRLLETNIWQSDILSIDSAIGIFKQSGITLKQLRDIWTIADKKGSGSLSKNELVVVIRLMGWVQSGEPLRESLLARAGPMPFIKGVTDIGAPRSANWGIDQAGIALQVINPEAMERYAHEFTSATEPLNGILSHNEMLVVLVMKNISYSVAMKIMSLVDSNSQAEFDFPNFALGLHIGELLQSSKIPSLPTALPQCLRDQVSDFKPPPPPYPPAAPLYSLHEHTTPLKKSELSSKISLPPPPTIDPALSGLPKSVLPYIPPARSADNFAPSQPTIPAQLAQKLHDASSRREFPRIENFSPKLLENTGMDTSSLSLHVQQLLDSQTKELNQLRHTNQLLRDQNQTFQSRVRELEMDVSTSALQLEENRRQETQDRAEINHLTARLEISEEDLAILQQDYRRVALANPRKSSEESFDEKILASLRKEHQEQEINLLASQAALDRSQELLRQSLDTQAWLIAELKGLLVEKKDCMDQLTTLKRNPDMRLLFLRTSLRASQTALTKAQDEALSLRQTITYQCETISDLRGQLRVFYL